MRLSDHLAARRRLYPRALPTLPDLLLIDVPASFAGATLPLNRYYPVVLETVAEAREMEAFLHADRSTLVVPDLMDRRASALQSSDILFARYAPPSADWPWVLLCCWPKAYTAMVPTNSDIFARQAYTIEVFRTVQDVNAAEKQLLSSLGPFEARHVRQVDGHAGHA